MRRARFQILVIPFRRRQDGSFEFAALRRSDDGKWQGIAGGGEEGESPVAAAMREAEEEAGVPASAPFYRLDTIASIPVFHFAARREWPKDLFVIPEYAFAADCTGFDLRVSEEHCEPAWGSYKETALRLSYDSNRTALWELDERLHTDQLGAPANR